MAAIDMAMDIPIPLALEFEGRARTAGLSAEKYLKMLMNNATYRGVATTRLQREIEAKVRNGFPDAEIAEELGCTKHYVIQVRNKLGLPPNKERVLDCSNN